MSRPPVRFPLGQVLITPAAQDACAPDRLIELLQRHMRGDWGNVDVEDKMSNDAALVDGGRLQSAYPIDGVRPSAGFGENTLWIITEADRSVTTFLLPSDY